MTDLWADSRYPRKQEVKSSSQATPATISSDIRSAFQHDYDRILFSAPVRRLADKTQVWPMDENDGVRTRLTHSHEVANLARSIGTRISKSGGLPGADLMETIQPILQAIGLAHDLGNPPFGHQGEAAIGRWFSNNFASIEKKCPPEEWKTVKPYLAEFENFDGNAQTIRLLVNLQAHIAGLGLDLTAATLVAALKYPVGTTGVDKTIHAKSKIGYFWSEEEIIRWVRDKTGLEEGQRHPLTWIMEACDDIAYSVLDVDDVLKKGIISPDDVLITLDNDKSIADKKIIEKIKSKFTEISHLQNDSDIKKDIKIQYLRAYLLEDLIKSACDNFSVHRELIFNFRHTKGLLDDNDLCLSLKKISKKFCFNNEVVLRQEAIGADAIDGLMTAFWKGITDRKDRNTLLSKRNLPFSKYMFSLISPNYVECAVRPHTLPTVYREMRLLTDMISGMTDTFALNLWHKVQAIPQ